MLICIQNTEFLFMESCPVLCIFKVLLHLFSFFMQHLCLIYFKAPTFTELSVFRVWRETFPKVLFIAHRLILHSLWDLIDLRYVSFTVCLMFWLKYFGSEIQTIQCLAHRVQRYIIWRVWFQIEITQNHGFDVHSN